MVVGTRRSLGNPILKTGVDYDPVSAVAIAAAIMGRGKNPFLERVHEKYPDGIFSHGRKTGAESGQGKTEEINSSSDQLSDLFGLEGRQTLDLST